MRPLRLVALRQRAHYTDPGDVGRYLEMLGKLEALAVYGDEVRQLLADLAAQYRAMTP